MGCHMAAPEFKNIGAGGNKWIIAALIIVALFEGMSTTVYDDVVGVPTVCYGATAADGVDLTRVYTSTECKAMLSADLLKYDAMVRSCVKVSLPPDREAALVSFTYNLGRGALCHGAVARRLNAGDVAGGCRAILAYNHAGGRVLRGLTIRRHKEYELCMKDY